MLTKGLLTVASLALLLAFVSPVDADTIYLKNGRIIRCSDAKIVDGKVEFEKYGGKVSFLMKDVERIEQDEYQTPASASDQTPSTPPPAEPPSYPTDSDSASGVPVAPVNDEGNQEEPEGKKTEDKNTREFWQKRKAELEEKIEKLEENLDTLLSSRRANFGQFNKSDSSAVKNREESIEKTRSELEAARKELQNLPNEARKAGARPGWVR